MTIENKIHIKVKAEGLLKALSSDRFELKNRSSVLDCMNLILEKASQELRKLIFDQETNKVNSAIGIFVNGSLVERMESELKDGDELAIFIVVAGG